MSPKEYIHMIRPYLSDLIIDYKTQGKRKIQLIMTINFISSKDSDETCNLRTKINNIEIMMGNETDEITDELFETFSQNYQKDLEESTRGIKFNFDSVDLLYYNLQKASLNGQESSYIDSPKWLKDKKKQQ